MQKNIFSNHISGGIHMITPKLLCIVWMIQNKWAVLKYPNSILSCALKNRNFSFQFSSVAQWCLTLCDPTKCSTPGLPVHHQLPELTQTQVHWVGDAIQSFHPLSSPFPPTFHLSQHQDLFKWVSSLHQVAKVLEFQVQQSVLPMNIQDWSSLGWRVLN